MSLSTQMEDAEMVEEEKTGREGALYSAPSGVSHHWYQLLSILGFGMNVARLEKARVYEAAQYVLEHIPEIWRLPGRSYPEAGFIPGERLYEHKYSRLEAVIPATATAKDKLELQRLRCLKKCRKAGLSPRQVTELLEVSLSYVRRRYRQLEKCKDVMNLIPNMRKRRTIERHKEQSRVVLSAMVGLQIQQMTLATLHCGVQKEIKERRLKMSISRAHLRALLRGPLRQSYAKCSIRCKNEEDQSLRELRIRWCVLLLGLYNLHCRLIFIDECSSNVLQMRRYVWKPTGQAMALHHNPRQTSIASIVALDENGLVHAEHMPHTIGAATFIGFLQNLVQILQVTEERGALGGALP